MNYKIKGVGFNPDISFTDSLLVVGDKEYKISDITNIQISFNPTFLTNGVVTCVVGGKDLTLAYSKKDQDIMSQAVNEIKQIIDKNIEKMGIKLDTAEEMYDYCIKCGFGKGMTKSWGEKHFQVIVDNLLKDEKVIFPFIGLHNYKKMTQHDDNYAYVVTNKRILMAQQKLIGQNFQTVNIENINDITMKKDVLLGVIIIDTLKEIFNVGVDRTTVQNIHDTLHKAIEKAKQNDKNEVDKVNNKESAVNQVKELKELLDLGIITQDEFDKKKKELLNL